MGEALNGGKLCPVKWQSKKCMVKACPVHCAVSKWTKFDKCSQKCGGGLQIATRKVTTFAKLGGNTCPILQKVQRCNYQTCRWTQLRAPQTKKARKYTVHYTTGSLRYADSKGAIKVALVGTKGRSKYYTIGRKFAKGGSGATTIKMKEDIGLLFGISLKATSADGWNTVNFIDVDTPSKQTVQFRTDYWLTTKKHKQKLAYKTYPYAKQVGIKAVNAEEGLKKGALSTYAVTFKTGNLRYADSKQPMFIQLQGSLGKSKYYKLANRFYKGRTVTTKLRVDEHVGLLKSISLEAGGVDAWHVDSLSVATPAKQTIQFKTDFWLDDQPMHGKKYLGKHFYYQKEVKAVKKETPTRLTNIYAGRAEVKLPTRAPTVAPKKISFKPLVKKATGVVWNKKNKKVTAFPTSKPTRAPTVAPKKQCLNGAAFVAHGWHGAGAKGNYCNFCKCNNGALKCTKRKCGMPTKVPARAKTCTNVKCAWTMQVRGKNMKAPKHHIEVSHHHLETGPNHRCAFNAATKKCTCYCWGKATPTYATVQKGRAKLAPRGFVGRQCTDIKFKTAFNPKKGAVNVVHSITHMSPTPKWEHDAPISWIEKASSTGFRVCARESKNFWHSKDRHDGKLNIDYYANHQNDYDLDWAKSHDALMTYVDDVYKTHFKVCTAELGRHDKVHAANVKFDWVAFK